MKFDRKAGNILNWLAIAAGGTLLSNLAAPGVMPQLVPPEYLPFALFGLQLGQKILQNRAWERNWNGTPAELPAPSDPQRRPRR